MDEETTWRWRWRCPDCDEVIQGEGDAPARRRAERVIGDHRADERMIRRAS